MPIRRISEALYGMAYSLEAAPRIPSQSLDRLRLTLRIVGRHRTDAIALSDGIGYYPVRRISEARYGQAYSLEAAPRVIMEDHNQEEVNRALMCRCRNPSRRLPMLGTSSRFTALSLERLPLMAGQVAPNYG